MSRSGLPSHPSLFTRLALALLVLGGCGDDPAPCGAAVPADAQAELVTAGSEHFSYGGFHAALAGDCPVETGSRGSVTITGQQVGSEFPLTLCVRREDDVRSGQAIDLGDDGFIQVVDVSAIDASGCTYRKDSSAEPTGTITFDGFCTRGGAVYNFTLAGSIAGVRTCAGGVSDAMTFQLDGTASITMDATP